MATWHQSRNPAPLYSETQWTVVTDPPHRCLSLMRFDTSEQAQLYIDNLKANAKGFEQELSAKHSYALPPSQRS